MKEVLLSRLAQFSLCVVFLYIEHTLKDECTRFIVRLTWELFIYWHTVNIGHHKSLWETFEESSSLKITAIYSGVQLLLALILEQYNFTVNADF